ncbi:MAG: hypothetical protein Q9213_004356 [Squamulea squamosa]
MLSLTQTFVGLVSFAIIATTGSVRLEPRANCANNYRKCDPKGASATEPPAVGTGLSSLYTDLVNSVNGANKLRRDIGEPSEELRFFLEPRSSTGQIVSGAYSPASGGQANLINGDYTLADGTKGNIYGSEDSPSKPDTAALPIPTQYTASGSDSAIAATALGQVATITTTIPGTTVEPSVVSEETIAPSVSGTSTVQPATTKAASTIPGTTIPAKTSTYTTTFAAAAATGKSQAVVNKPDMSGAAGLGLLLYMMFGL